ncbi:uncharacterized protein LOC118644410 isoform X2 [Monomorium pharaonis]|uniref:uncharacterized protein LOC118644410 isoform X2 n=1 Tax=Monomorium pharaonis TaxID=307658 RepID=UPI001747B8E5|nr:uncharacterized protein LOC118644410 isoform X2 [Monomorium pharaonis]
MIKKRIISKYDHLLNLTTIGNMEKAIERNRKQNLGCNPKNLNDLCNVLKTHNWKQLLMIDLADHFLVEFVLKNNCTKAVIFIDKILMDILNNEINEERTIYVDGTFATVPQLTNNNCQLWTILMRHNNRTFPIVYGIMEGRKTENYIDVLKKVVDIISLTPATAMSDFDKAEQKALKTVFPHAKVIGCYFYYSQALIDNADKRGILKGSDKELGWDATKLLIYLALLPKQLIEEGFYIIANIIFDGCINVQPFINYYKDTWLNGFKPGTFCVFRQKHRTNNISERPTRSLNRI